METFTIPQIVEQRICLAPMTKEQFEKFKEKSVEHLKIDTKKFDVQYFENRFYILLESPHRIFCSELDMTTHFIDKAWKTINFSQIDFEENKVENSNQYEVSNGRNGTIYGSSGGFKKPEELDLTKLLIEGETYYSPAYGHLIYKEFHEDNHPLLIFKHKETSVKEVFFPNGTIHNYGECLLFPSKEIRTWQNYSPFKKGEVCVFQSEGSNWKVITTFFSKEDGYYFTGKFEDGIYVKSQRANFCEKYDPSKFNF